MKKIYLSSSNVANADEVDYTRRILAKFNVEILEYQRGTRFDPTSVEDADALVLVLPGGCYNSVGKGQYDVYQTFIRGAIRHLQTHNDSKVYRDIYTSWLSSAGILHFKKIEGIKPYDTDNWTHKYGKVMDVVGGKTLEEWLLDDGYTIKQKEEKKPVEVHFDLDGAINTTANNTTINRRLTIADLQTGMMSTDTIGRYQTKRSGRGLLDAIQPAKQAVKPMLAASLFI